MKLLSCLLILLTLFPAVAGARMTTCVIGGTIPATGGGCNVADNEVGSRAEGSAGDLQGDYAWAYRAQADCTGTLEAAYINHLNTTAAGAKVCVYASSASTPQSADAKIGCSGEILSGTTTGWKTGSIGSGSVTSGNYYWVVIAISGALDNWNLGYGSTGTIYYNPVATFSYSSPPATMGASWSDLSAAYQPLSIYVRIQ